MLFHQIRNSPAYQMIIARLLCSEDCSPEAVNASGMDHWFRLCVKLGSDLTPLETLVCALRLFLYAASLAYFAPALLKAEA
jgi:hypothetical protein